MQSNDTVYAAPTLEGVQVTITMGTKRQLPAQIERIVDRVVQEGLPSVLLKERGELKKVVSDSGSFGGHVFYGDGGSDTPRGEGSAGDIQVVGGTYNGNGAESSLAYVWCSYAQGGCDHSIVL